MSRERPRGFDLLASTLPLDLVDPTKPNRTGEGNGQGARALRVRALAVKALEAALRTWKVRR